MDELNEHDPKLEALFAREHAHLAAEPFLSNTLALVAAERRRAVVMRRVLQALGIVAFLAASPWLIEGSVWVSSAIEWVFARASDWLAHPAGIAVGVLVAAGLLLRSRLRVW